MTDFVVYSSSIDIYMHHKLTIYILYKQIEYDEMIQVEVTTMFVLQWVKLNRFLSD